MSFLSTSVRTGYVSAGHSAPGNLKGPARRSLGPVSVWKYGRKPAPGLPTVGTNSGAIVRKSRLDKLPDAFSSGDCGGAGRPAGRATRSVSPRGESTSPWHSYCKNLLVVPRSQVGQLHERRALWLLMDDNLKCWSEDLILGGLLLLLKYLLYVVHKKISLGFSDWWLRHPTIEQS